MRILRRDSIAAELKWPLAIAGVCSVISTLLVEQPKSDIASYYGPLTQAFIDSRYSRAFFHMISPLVPTLAGIIGKTGLHSFTALKIVSSLFYVAALFPLCALLSRTYERRTARIGCLLYSIHPRLMRYGTIGLFESAKTFFLLFILERMFRWHCDRKPLALVHIGVGCAALTLARGEGVLFAVATVAAIPVVSLIGDMRRTTAEQRSYGKAALRSVASGGAVLAIMLALTSPWLVYEYRATGLPVPNSMLIGTLPRLGIRTEAMKSHTHFIKDIVFLGEENPVDVVTPLRNAVETVKAISVPYLILLLLGLYWRLRDILRERRATVAELAPDIASCSVFGMNLAMFLVNGAIIKRYVTPTVPFLLGWCARGARGILDFGDRQKGRLRQAFTVAIVAFIVVNTGDGLLKVRSSLYRKNIARDIADWIAQHRDELDVCQAPPLDSPKGTYLYQSGQQPVVAGSNIQDIIYFANADAVIVGGNVCYPYSSFVRYLRDKQVDIFLRDPGFTRQCPEFDAKNADFELINDTWEAHGIVIYRLKPTGSAPSAP